jgi:hypothetical protein
MNKLEKQRRKWQFLKKQEALLYDEATFTFFEGHEEAKEKLDRFEDQFLDKFFENYRYCMTRIGYTFDIGNQISFIYIVKEKGRWFLIDLTKVKDDFEPDSSPITLFSKFVEITPEYAKDLTSAQKTLSKLSLLKN